VATAKLLYENQLEVQTGGKVLWASKNDRTENQLEDRETTWLPVATLQHTLPPVAIPPHDAAKSVYPLPEVLFRLWEPADVPQVQLRNVAFTSYSYVNVVFYVLERCYACCLLQVQMCNVAVQLRLYA
jgi:hypothetical protein